MTHDFLASKNTLEEAMLNMQYILRVFLSSSKLYPMIRSNAVHVILLILKVMLANNTWNNSGGKLAFEQKWLQGFISWKTMKHYNSSSGERTLGEIFTIFDTKILQQYKQSFSVILIPPLKVSNDLALPTFLIHSTSNITWYKGTWIFKLNIIIFKYLWDSSGL